MAQQNSLQWKYRGRRGFVIGGGASIKQLIEDRFDFPILVKNEVVVGVNKAYRLCTPQVIVSIDINFLRNSAEELISLEDTLKVLPTICKEHFDEDDPNIFLIDDQCKISRNVSHKRISIPRRFDQFCYVGGSGLFGIKVAYVLGLNPIYLIGFDCKTINGSSHFHDEYGEPLSDNRLKGFSMSMIGFADNIRKHENVEVYCCNEDSLLVPHLPYRNLEEVLHARIT